MTTLQAGRRRRSSSGGLDPVHDRHPHVHQHHVGLQRQRLLDRLPAVGGGADHRDPGLDVQQRGDALPDQLLVVDDQHPHGVGPGHADRPVAARRRRSRVPRARVGVQMSTAPPTSATRSRMPRSPKPSPAGVEAAAVVGDHQPRAAAVTT